MKMSACEGADRKWKRDRRTEPTDEPDYKCENCAHGEFIVIYEAVFHETVFETLVCQHTGNVAAARQMSRRTRLLRTGLVNGDHRIEWEGRPELRDGERFQLDYEKDVACDDCYSDTEPTRWEEREAEVEEIPGAEVWQVRCARCGHQTEFGWSHPDRGGRIWPVESSDFNPWKSWPEPRFAEDWQRRGWRRLAIAGERP